jgi:hypothetical protein
MKAFLARLGHGLYLLYRLVLWLVVIVVLVGLIAMVSVAAAAVAGVAALVVGWWSRTERTLGVLAGAVCLVGGIGLSIWKPGLQNSPLASCTAYPIPFVQAGSSPDRKYLPSTPLPIVAKPWVAATVAKTYEQLQVLQGAAERVAQARNAAIEYARTTGTSLIALDALLRAADERLLARQLTDLAAIRASLPRHADAVSAKARTEKEFQGLWGQEPDVHAIADVALVLTNLDIEIAKLFSGIQPPAYSLHAEVRGRDLIFRESVGLTSVGGRFTKVDPSGLLDAARQRGIQPVLLWSAQPSEPLRQVTPDVIDLGEGSPSVVLGLEWTQNGAVVDTCRKLSALAFQGINIGIPVSYSTTIRGEVLPDSKSESVPVKVKVDAGNTLKEISLPAYSYFLSGLSLQSSEPIGHNADEQVFTIANGVTAESLRDTQFWIEMLPTQLRRQPIQDFKSKLFPANASVTLVLLGLAMLGSVAVRPK